MCDTSMTPLRVAIPKSVMKSNECCDRCDVHARDAADQCERKIEHDEQCVARRPKGNIQEQQDACRHRGPEQCERAGRFRGALQVKPGDRVRFAADKIGGAFTVTALEPAK